MCKGSNYGIRTAVVPDLALDDGPRDSEARDEVAVQVGGHAGHDDGGLADEWQSQVWAGWKQPVESAVARDGSQSSPINLPNQGSQLK